MKTVYLIHADKRIVGIEPGKLGIKNKGNWSISPLLGFK
jgi:hypothetical protein